MELRDSCEIPEDLESKHLILCMFITYINRLKISEVKDKERQAREVEEPSEGSF